MTDRTTDDWEDQPEPNRATRVYAENLAKMPGRDWRKTHTCRCGHPGLSHGLSVGGGVYCTSACLCAPVPHDNGDPVLVNARATPITQGAGHGHNERGFCEACMRQGERRYADYLLQVAQAARKQSTP